MAKETKYSEAYFIDLVVKHKLLVNKKVWFEPDMVPEFFNEVLYHQEEPFGSFSAIAQYLVFKRIKEETGIVVLLSGQGGMKP